MPSPLRPHTLTEALEILARPMLVQVTAGGPPPRIKPHALLMDAGRVTEMAGIHRARGEVSVGVNCNWEKMMRSSLLQPAAACLTDAAALMEMEQPGGVLLHALDAAAPDNPILLALTALNARIGLAVREEDGRITRSAAPLRQILQSSPSLPHLFLDVRYAAPLAHVGSALFTEGELFPMQPDAQAAAATIVIDPDSGRISTAQLALAIPQNWPVRCPAINAILGQKPQKETIEAVVRLAQRNCPQPRVSAPQFSLTLSSHLIREALDRAIARSQVT